MEKLDEKRLTDMILRLERDLPMLSDEECYQPHEPAYHEYIMYYDNLVAQLLALTPETSKSVFSAYLIGILAYQILDLDYSLSEAVMTIIDKIKARLEMQESLDEGKSYFGAVHKA